MMMAWFGGAYEGAEDVAIWTAKRDPRGGEGICSVDPRRDSVESTSRGVNPFDPRRDSVDITRR